jgi:hypothetical protein
MEDDPVRCLACQRAVEGTMDDPTSALIFTSSGGYGSGLFDSTRQRLRIVVCDRCVRSAALRGQVEIGTPPPPGRWAYQPFDARHT